MEQKIILEPQETDITSSSNFFSKIFKGDKVIWSVFIFLCAISLVEVFSATSTIVYRQQNHWAPILRHAVFLMGGVGVILFMHNVPYRYFSSLIFVLLFSIILMVVTRFVGTTINGAERWFTIFGISIQPSELAKISLMGTVAFLLSKQNGKNDRILFLWMIGLISIVCAIIVIDNLSTAVLLFLVCYILMFIGNVSFSRLLKVAVAGIAIISLFVLLLKVTPPQFFSTIKMERAITWQSRLDTFFDKSDKDEADYYAITKETYQVAHSKIAIANGSLFGKFPGNSKARDFLPQAYSDFIYSIILEELGILGGTFVLMLYIMILIRAGIIARKTDKLFPKYLILGSALMISMQAMVHMAVAVNIIPVTGQPLPLISRGGTSTLITCAYFGIILSADRFGIGRKRSSIGSINNENDEKLIVDNKSIDTDVLQEEYISEIDFEVIQA